MSENKVPMTIEELRQLDREVLVDTIHDLRVHNHKLEEENKKLRREVIMNGSKTCY